WAARWRASRSEWCWPGEWPRSQNAVHWRFEARGDGTSFASLGVLRQGTPGFGPCLLQWLDRGRVRRLRRSVLDHPALQCRRHRRRPRPTESGGRRSNAAPGSRVTSIAWSGTRCRCDGWWRSPHTIYMAQGRLDDRRLAEHEMLHDLLQRG